MLFALSYGYARFSHGREDGVPWYERIVLVVIFLSFFLCIFEGLFIINAKLLYKKVAFDQSNVYITSKGKDTVVPFGNILRIDMLSTGIGSRGAFYGYEISYKDANGNSGWFYLTVYWKKNKQFHQFTNLVRGQNALLQVKTIATAIGGIIKLFSRKNQVV
jgi:hypothetical protein